MLHKKLKNKTASHSQKKTINHSLHKNAKAYIFAKHTNTVIKKSILQNPFF